MSAAEFSAYATGKTLTYAENGQPYGSEQYLPNNRVRWAFNEEICMEGVWYEDQSTENICFLYDTGETPECWSFYLEDDKLRAVFNGISGTELYEAWASEGPLRCVPPGLGV